MKETKKQEAIRLAYGEYWEQVKEYVDMDSGVLRIHISDLNDYEPLKLVYHERSRYRPLSLHGIENNNFWYTVESEADLPTDDEPIWVMIDGLELPELVQPNSSEDEYHGSDGFIYNSRHITHYHPIVKPKPPIF